MNSYDRFVEAYIGKKYEKIMKCKFSIFSFIFGSAHWAYRKMLLESVILILVTAILPTVVGKVTNNIILLLIIQIIMALLPGFLFAPVYKMHVTRKVKKIVEMNTSSDYEVMQICEKKGGTSIIYMIISSVIGGFVFSITVIATIVGIISSMFGMLGVDLSTDKAEYDYPVKHIITNNFSYYLRKDINISEYVELDIPEGFSKSEEFESEIWEYEFYENSDSDYSSELRTSPLGSFEISLVSEDYNSPETFIKELKEDGYLDLDYYAVNLNDKIWYVIANSFVTAEYYNVVKCDENILLLLKYNIDTLNSDKYESMNQIYYDIMNSIKIKSKIKDDFDEKNVVDNIKLVDKETSEYIEFEENENALLKLLDDCELEIDDSGELLDFISLQIPDVFQGEEIIDESNEYLINLLSDNKEDKNDEYEMAIFAVKDENSSEEVINKIAEKNAVEADVYSVELENGTWCIVPIQANETIYYYNAIEIYDKVIVLYCKYGNEIANEEILNSYNDLIFSIEAIENTEENFEQDIEEN